MSDQRKSTTTTAKKSPTFLRVLIPSVLRKSKVWTRCFTPSEEENQTSNELTINQTSPGRVLLTDGKEWHFAMEPGMDGSTLELKRVYSNQNKAATRIQDAFRRYKARELYQSLESLHQMDFEVKWPDGSPFIGLLMVKVNSIRNLTAIRHAFLRAKFDDDQSHTVYGLKDENQIVQFDYRATFTNIALRSNSILTIEVLQGTDMTARLLGKVSIPISTLNQGVENRDLSLVASGKEIGVMSVIIGYQWLRGTTDYGGYNGPELLMVPSRKIRGVSPGQAVERLWKVNHWVCSHDNVWSTAPDFGDIVLEAMRKRRTQGRSFEVIDANGVKSVVDPSHTVKVMREANDTEVKTSLTSMKLMENVLGTLEYKSLPTVDSILPLTSSLADSIFGPEDWNKTLSELQSIRTLEIDVPSLEIEEEDSFDITKSPVELNDVQMQAESSEDGASIPTPAASEPDLSPVVSMTSSQRIDHNRRHSVAHKCPAALKVRRKKRGKPTSPVVSGKFEYGVYRPASDRGVHIYLRRCDNTSNEGDIEIRPIYIGSHQTSKTGRLEVPLPRHVCTNAGLYHVMALLPDDNTFGHGSLYLLEKGTKCVVFDLDGTITTSDVHVVAQTLLDSVSASTVIGSSLGRSYDLKARPNALACVRAWAAKGYQVVYLSGRQGSAYNLTLEWLIKHGYPPGPIHLTRTHLPTLPVYVSVGHFKIKYMKELMAKGFEIYAAYGNTGTDIKAYEVVGIPKERTFIVGSNGGRKNTVAVKDFTSHLLDVLKLPDSEKPLPYTELLSTIPWQKTGLLE